MNEAENQNTKTPWWNYGWVFVLFIFAATFIVYFPVWHPVPDSAPAIEKPGFLWDDDVLCVANPLIKDPHGWYKFWITTKTPDYFPIMSSAFWIEWRLWGMNPIGYHVVNIFLHATDAVLLWLLLARLMPRFGAAAKLAAAIFALHPVNVESVAWIAELKNTLSLFFFVLSLLWYLKFDDTSRWRWYSLSFVAFLFALWSKIEVAPLPFVLLGFAWWRRDRIGWKDILRSVPFFGAAFVLGLVSVWFQNHVAIAHDVVRTDNFFSRLAGAGWAVWFYFFKTVWPANLLPIYPRWHIDATDLLSYAPGILLAAIFFACWLFRKSWGRPVLLGLGYAVLMYLPILGFLNIYFFRFSFVANHWEYFSIIGLTALASLALTKFFELFGSEKKIVGAIVSAFLLSLLGALSWAQAGIYRNAEMLWSTTLTQNPDSFTAHNNLGFVYLQRGQVDDSLPHFERAVLLQSDDEAAQKNLGSAFLQKGRVDEAIAQFQKALEIRPDDVGAMNNLGLALSRKGQVDDAIAEYEKALKVQPDDPGVHHNLGITLFRRGQVDEAMAHYRKALEIQPDSMEAHNDLANALSRKGQMTDAIREWQKAIELHTNYMPAQNNLAWALATNPDASVRDGAKAVALARRANQLSGGKNPVVLHTLAAAYAENKQFHEAVSTAGEALQQAVIQHNLSLAQAIQAQSKFYEDGQPFHTGESAALTTSEQP